jgi:hypothetical protein
LYYQTDVALFVKSLAVMASKRIQEGKPRRAWHVLMAVLLNERKPSGFELFSEVQLSKEPLRMDYLLLRRKEVLGQQEKRAEVFRFLWEHLPQESIVELKTASHPLRAGELDKLLAYAHLRKYSQQTTLTKYNQLALVLVVHHRTPLLAKELSKLGGILQPMRNGYHYLQGTFRLFIVELAIVARHEADAILALFDPEVTPSTMGRQWLATHLAGELEAMAIDQMEEFDEVLQKFTEKYVHRLTPEQRLVGLPPEQRMLGLKPEQRLVGLKPEQRLLGLDEAHTVLALPKAILRGLSPEYLKTLPDEVQAEVQRRLAEPNPV